jgi:hypothetical protein
MKERLERSILVCKRPLGVRPRASVPPLVSSDPLAPVLRRHSYGFRKASSTMKPSPPRPILRRHSYRFRKASSTMKSSPPRPILRQHSYRFRKASSTMKPSPPRPCTQGRGGRGVRGARARVGRKLSPSSSVVPGPHAARLAALIPSPPPPCTQGRGGRGVRGGEASWTQAFAEW